MALIKQEEMLEQSHALTIIRATVAICAALICAEVGLSQRATF